MTVLAGSLRSLFTGHISAAMADDRQIEVQDSATLGVSYDSDTEPPIIGPDSIVRSGTVIYDDVVVGRELQTGHNALIREVTTLGDGVLIGTNAVIDGYSTIGDAVSIQTGAYVPRNTDLGDRSFLGPNAVLLNDMYPVRSEYDLVGPTLGSDVSIGANATVLPDITIGDQAFIAAGTVVTEDVPPETLAVGNPAEHRQLPSELDSENNL